MHPPSVARIFSASSVPEDDGDDDDIPTLMCNIRAKRALAFCAKLNADCNSDTVKLEQIQKLKCSLFGASERTIQLLVM